MEATGQLLTELCESLVKDHKYDVSVLCGQPNSITPNADYRAVGTAVHNGVTIRRTWHTQFDKGRFWGRAINFVSFCISAFFSLLFGRRPDVIVCQTDPPLSPIAACLVAFVRRTRFVCYLQDVYPDIAVECGKLREGFFVKVLRKFLVWCYRQADQIVVVSNDMKAWLQAHGVDPAKVTVMHNWVDADAIRPIKTNNSFRTEHGLDEKFVVMYSGNVGQTQRFEIVLEAAQRLNKESHIEFVIVGGGVKLAGLQAEARKLRLQNMRFIDFQPKSRLAESLSAGDVQLVLLDKRMTRLMMPSKLYSALAVGTPVLGLGDTTSHLAEIVTQNHCGWFFEESDVKQFVAMIRSLAAKPDQAAAAGRAGRKLAVAEFDRDTAVRHFVNIIDATELVVAPAPKSRSRLRHRPVEQVPATQADNATKITTAEEFAVTTPTDEIPFVSQKRLEDSDNFSLPPR